MTQYREATAAELVAHTTGRVLRTRTNSHRVVEFQGRDRIVCKLTSDAPLPKGDLEPEGKFWATINGESVRLGLTTAVCHNCNGVNTGRMR
jgi:hypothetical protein